MKIIVKIKWVSNKNQWHMEMTNGNFINEFYNCPAFQKIFKELNKKKSNLYTVEIQKWKK